MAGTYARPFGSTLGLRVPYTRVYRLDRAHPCPWIAKIGQSFIRLNIFTVDYTESEIADDPAQHKQSHVLELLDAGLYGQHRRLPTIECDDASSWFETGEGPPDFPSQHTLFKI